MREFYRESWLPGVPSIRQLVHSESGPHVMRAMHAHKRQWDIWHFVRGSRVQVITYDLARAETHVWVVGAGDILAIAPGVAHGFLASFGATLVYALTEEYDGSDEFGFDAYDPDFPGAKHWGLNSEDVLRSQRDLTSPSFREFMAGWHGL